MKVGAKLVFFFDICKKKVKKMHTTKQVVRLGKENRLYSEQNVEERKAFVVRS